MNDSAPRVSVIMPFLDAGAHFEAAIESALAQTYDSYELVLVDDGSTDGSSEVAEQCAQERADRVVLLGPDPANRGAAAARNRGIAAARGSLIAFLDADDLYLPRKLEEDVHALDADERAAWVYRSTRWFHERARRRDWTDRPGVRLDTTFDPPTLLVHTLLEDRGDVPCTCSVMIRRGPLESVGGFETRFELYEDQSLWAKLMLAYPVRVASGCYAMYRQHDNSTSAAATARGTYDVAGPHSARDEFLAWLRTYAEGHGAPPTVFAAVERAMRDRGGTLSRLRRRLRRLKRYVTG